MKLPFRGRIGPAGHMIVGRASWALVDQGVVSLGGFLINILLARSLSSADYGVFVLFMGAVFLLRSIDYSLISYPLSVRLSALPTRDHPHQLGNAAVLVAALCTVLAAVLCLGAIVLGRADIAFAITLCYLCWQVQETSRRFLTATFRFRTAVWGDAVSFLGQGAAIYLLGKMGVLTLETALYAIAAAFLAGAVVHLMQLTLAHPKWQELRALVGEHFHLGKWSLAANEVVLLRTQLFPWMLAALVGTTATASFQAALNVANLMNPALIGIGSAVAQAAAQARLTGGLDSAWRVGRGYILVGAPVVLVAAGIGILMPGLALRLMYGADSPYLTLTLCVQLLAFAWACEYVGAMIVETMIGSNLGGSALLVNAVGAAAAIVAIPVAIPYGVQGACAALVFASVVRLIFSVVLLRRKLAGAKEIVGMPEPNPVVGA
jgi:O-antigen/teichoic acid export membrane protein